MANTKFYLDLRGKAQDGKGSILISIFQNKTTATIPTGIRVSTKEWSGEQVVHRDDAHILNAKLSTKKSKIDNAIAALSLVESFDDMTATEIKHSITKHESKDRHLVSVLFEEYMNTGLSDGTKEIYATTLGKILAFGGHKIKIESITVKWLYEFEQFLSKTQGVNGRSIYLRCLRAVYNYAVKTKVVTFYPFDAFQIKNETTRKRCITKDLFRKFIEFPVKNKRTVMYRDYFMLMFYLIGINAIDLLTARPDAIVNGRFEYIRRKTNKRYSIKIEPEAQAIIDRYRGKNYLLDALDHCQHTKSFLHMMNDALKTIGPEEVTEVINQDELFSEQKRIVKPIISDITTYFARHTWATFASELDISFDTISQALGHSAGNRTTLIYIRFDQSKIDAANRAVIDYLYE